MWKKEEDEAQPGQATAERSRPKTPVSVSTNSGKATIGPSISIRGDVTGSEDLLIQGQVDGSVTLDLHTVAVGSGGRVNANITGRIITIEGEVEGDLTAQEQIILLGSAQVHGDIKAPRVVLEDGATFRGLVDMGTSPKNAKASEAGSTDRAASGVSAAKAVNGAADKLDAPKPSGGPPKASDARSGAERSRSGSGKDSAGAVDRAVK